jgi:hypothetical protein
MQTDRLAGVHKKLSSLENALLPILAPFFLQIALAIHLSQVFPWFIGVALSIGLVICHLFGPVGFCIAAGSLATFLSIDQPDFLHQATSLLFFSSCLVSLLVASLCARQHRQKFSNLEEVVSSLFSKNVELQKTATDAEDALQQVRKNSQQQIEEHESLVSELEAQVTLHQDKLTLARQEVIFVKEDTEKRCSQWREKCDAAQSESLLYLKEKEQIQQALIEAQQNLDAALEQRQASQKEFLEDFSKLQEQLDAVQLANTKLLEESEQTEVIQSNIDGGSVCIALQEQSVYWESLYKQLRLQFDEKSLVLSGTRRELFFIENQLLSMKKEQEEESREESEDQKMLIGHLQQLDIECQDLEEQVLFLEEIVSSLQDKKKKAQMKKRTSRSASNNLSDEISLFSL